MTNLNFALVKDAATRTAPRRIAAASAIAGLIVAALILMTPNLLFERLIVASGLPDLIAASAPPLGVKARLFFAIVAAGSISIVAFGILSIALRRKGGERPRRRSLEDEFFAYTPPAPRRRSDSHPDSPPRPPINAGEDLGTPLDLVDVIPDEGPAEASEQSVAAPDLRWEDDAAGEDDFAESAVPFHSEEDDAFDPEQADVDQESLTTEAVDFAAMDTVPSVPTPSMAEAEMFGGSADDAIPEESGPSEDADALPAAYEEVGETSMPPAPADADLAHLVARLEAGIARRRNRANRAANDSGEAASSVAPHPASRSGQDRELQGALRDALDALQKLNASG